MLVKATAAVAWALLSAPGGQGYSFISPPGPLLSRGPPRNRQRSGAQSLKCDATAPLIEATACRVLKLVLGNGRDAHVSCSVKSEALELLQGRLRGASVTGRGWASRLGLTARTVAVDIGAASVDIGALFRRRTVEFRNPPPSGRATVVFDAKDFGNFIAHKLVRRARLAGRNFEFARGGVVVEPVAGGGFVEFGGRWGNDRVRVRLSPASIEGGVVAAVSRGGAEGGKGEDADARPADLDDLAKAVGNYFDRLEIDLDGPKLRFVSLSFVEGGGLGGGRVKLELGIVVPKLPSVRAVASF